MGGWKKTFLLSSLHLQQRFKIGIQIIHTRGNHWIVASTVGCSEGEVKVYNSLYQSVHDDTRSLVINLFELGNNPKITLLNTNKQGGGADCGLFAIATATALAFGTSLSTFQQTGMRDHLILCFEQSAMKPFETV